MRVGAGTVLLAWANDRDGAKVDVRALDAASRRARAPFSCLGCGEPVVARLGAVRARHFAHRPGSACPLTAPETALHLDAKERLLALCRDAFAGARRVRVLARCPECRRPEPRDLAGLGDAAVAEGAVGPLRADVLVLARGAPALALEVRVTHALDAGKEAALAGAAIPFVEIDARDEWLREEAGAASIGAARSAGFPRCAACAGAARLDAERAKGGEAAEVAELEQYRARGLLGRASPDPDGLEAIARRFRCPECGGGALERGEAILRHACPGAAARPVAWRGIAGEAIALSWWSR
ncbi:MAG TPA: competence protein CoiA family protein [Anaeromyxobacter sp.]|nr:competence protein CoiA family protein [Anaeromyxobacter sp.]